LAAGHQSVPCYGCSQSVGAPPEKRFQSPQPAWGRDAVTVPASPLRWSHEIHHRGLFSASHSGKKINPNAMQSHTTAAPNHLFSCLLFTSKLCTEGVRGGKGEMGLARIRNYRRSYNSGCHRTKKVKRGGMVSSEVLLKWLDLR